MEKFYRAPSITNEIKFFLLNELPCLNGEQLVKVLGVLKNHQATDFESQQKIGTLLKSTNPFISNKAFEYLKNIEKLDHKVEEELNLYSRTLLSN